MLFFCNAGVTISFILAGASCVINALCYAELASRFPAVVGGAYLYSYTAFNELTAFLVFAQLMLDYHIGAASIARSLASYLINILELFPVLKDNIPKWIGHGEDIGDVLSINALAPILLVLLTIILCRGVQESSAVNSLMTVTKVPFHLSSCCNVVLTIALMLGAYLRQSYFTVCCRLSLLSLSFLLELLRLMFPTGLPLLQMV